MQRLRDDLWMARALLTLGTIQFFAPAIRDAGPSHLLNPAWAGHARFHLVWALAFGALIGVVNLALIWLRSPDGLARLRFAWVMQGTLLGGFWAAVGLSGSYGGQVTDPAIHHLIFGISENLVVFTAFSALLLASGLFVWRAGRAEGPATVGSTPSAAVDRRSVPHVG